jgi:hypothetical protein
MSVFEPLKRLKRYFGDLIKLTSRGAHSRMHDGPLQSGGSGAEFDPEAENGKR